MLFRATAHICTLPSSNPLHSLASRASKNRIKRDISFTTKTITPVRRNHEHSTHAHSTYIESSKDSTLREAIKINNTARIRVYVDGSGYKGGIGAAAVLYEGSRVIAARRYHLGKSPRYTVQNGEAVGIIIGLHLLIDFPRRLRGPVIIGCDSQAVIKRLANQKSHSGSHLLNTIHDLEERLHEKQYGIISSAERAVTSRNGERWRGRRRRVVDLQLHWVPGHKNFEPNERADREAKKAAEGLSSPEEELPACLRKNVLPASVAAGGTTSGVRSEAQQ